MYLTAIADMSEQGPISQVEAEAMPKILKEAKELTSDFDLPLDYTLKNMTYVEFFQEYDPAYKIEGV
eukprot:COSAG06_NODE_1783_length_8405_cov_109.734595_8_plen_67_part_00